MKVSKLDLNLEKYNQQVSDKLIDLKDGCQLKKNKKEIGDTQNKIYAEEFFTIKYPIIL